MEGPAEKAEWVALCPWTEPTQAALPCFLCPRSSPSHPRGCESQAAHGGCCLYIQGSCLTTHTWQEAPTWRSLTLTLAGPQPGQEASTGSWDNLCRKARVPHWAPLFFLDPCLVGRLNGIATFTMSSRNQMGSSGLTVGFSELRVSFQQLVCLGGREEWCGVSRGCRGLSGSLVCEFRQCGLLRFSVWCHSPIYFLLIVNEK